MAWGRTDDRECLDSRVGELTDAEYRARHALMQLCLREYRDDGIFPETRIVHAAYATPRGPRAVTKPMLKRFQELGFVKARDGYPQGDLDDLGIKWPEGEGWLRVHNWEKYNPPRDTTNADRQRRYRERTQQSNAVTNGVSDDTSNAVTNGPVTPPRAPPARASSVPSLTNTSLSLSYGESEHDDQEKARHRAWQLRAAATDVRSPGAFIRSGMASGDWPDPPPADARPVNMPTQDVAGRIAGLIRNGVIGDRFELDDEIQRAGLDPGEAGSLVAQFDLARALDETKEEHAET